MGLEIEIVSLLEKISRQLDGIASRLPMPPPRDLGKNPDNFYDQSAYKRESTGDGNFKYPTTYVSVQTKTTGGTNE